MHYTSLMKEVESTEETVHQHLSPCLGEVLRCGDLQDVLEVRWMVSQHEEDALGLLHLLLVVPCQNDIEQLHSEEVALHLSQLSED